MASTHYLIFICQTHLYLYQEEGDQLQTVAEFEENEPGLQAFEQFIASHPGGFYRVLVDVFEEDFRLDTVPHLTFGDSRKIIARRQDQLFRGLVYRTSTHQGREPEGRRDDRVLFTALTNTGQIDNWIRRLQVPDCRLIGIYSVALMKMRLATKLVGEKANVLLVTRQHGSGLRQTYLADGALKFSRLTVLGDEGLEHVGQTLVAEAVRARQFLASTRSIGRDDSMKVLVLACEFELEALRAVCTDQNQISFEFYSLETLAQKTGVPFPAEARSTEQFLLRLLSRKRPPNVYAPPQQLYEYRLWQAGLAINRGAIGLLIAGVAAASALAWDSRQLYLATQAIQQRIVVAEETYRQNAPPTQPGEPTPEAMKSAVLAVRELSSQWPGFRGDAIRLSRVLEQFPGIALDRLGWLVTQTPDTLPTGFEPGANGVEVNNPPPQTEAVPPAAPAVNEGSSPPTATPQYVVILLTGRAIDQGARYRNAMQLINQFSAALRIQPGTIITPLRLPIDPSASGRISLNSELTPPDAAFTLKVVYPLVTQSHGQTQANQ